MDLGIFRKLFEHRSKENFGFCRILKLRPPGASQPKEGIFPFRIITRNLQLAIQDLDQRLMQSCGRIEQFQSLQGHPIFTIELDDTLETLAGLLIKLEFVALDRTDIEEYPYLIRRIL